MTIRYFDNAATTRLDDEVLKEVIRCYKNEYGNPSSVYSLGRSAKSTLENAREQIASLLNCKSSELYFTSGGSESDNSAIYGISAACSKSGIVTSSIEHPAVLETVQSLEKADKHCRYISVNKDGIIDLDAAKELIKTDTGLVSTMLVNNETGVIQPINELALEAHKAGAYFHTDAVQATSYHKIDLQQLNTDSLSMSAHKFNGPKGIGILYLKTGTPFEKFIHGGHQERNRRAGTENTALAVGFAKALEITYNNIEIYKKRTNLLRHNFESAIKSEFPETVINGENAQRCCSITSLTFPGISADSIIMNLDLEGICVSAGSACASGSITPSHVLTAMGIEKSNAKSSIRVSFGKYNTEDETEYLIKTLTKIIKRLKTFK